MTINNTIRTAGPYIGNGITTAFPFYFKIFKTSELVVLQTDLTTGLSNQLVLNSGYTVVLNPDQSANPGGTATLPSALPIGKNLVLTSAVDYLQQLDITNGGGFYPAVINAALDRLTILCQQLFNLASRSLKFPLSDTGINTELPSSVARANNLLGFDSSGRPIAIAPNAQSATALQALLATSAGSGLIGHEDGTVARFLKRSPSKLGRVSAGDLPSFMATIRAYRHDLQLPLNVVGFGSSVGRGATLINPSIDAPVAWFYSQLKKQFDPAGLYNLQFANYCVDGSGASQFPAAWAAMLAAGITPKIVHLAYGMNDSQVALYNSGQTFNGFYEAMKTAILTAKEAGADVVICTSPHPSVVLHPEIYQMPSGVPQIYPTSIAAPVSPEQLLPPASQSTVTADFIGEGVSITVDHRMLRANQLLRNVAREFGCPVIDVERGAFEALQKYKLLTGSSAGAEGILFNPGESVHPNLVYHQESYQRETTDWVQAFSMQTAQPNYTPRLNGYYAINFEGTPDAVLDIRAKYNDLAKKLLSVKVQIGTPDANGVPAQVEMVSVDQTNGDIVQGAGGWRIRSKRELSGLISSIDLLGSCYGANSREHLQGTINTAIAYNVLLPDNSAGELIINSQNTGIGTSPHVKFYRWATKAGVLTLVANGADIGSLVITVSVSGLNVVVTPVASNTNIQAAWKAVGP